MPIHLHAMAPMRSKKPDGRGYRPVALGADVQFRPAEATATIIEAFRAAGANMRAAGERLGITERTLYRYVESLGISRQLDSIRERAQREGWHYSGRWPKKDE